MSTRPARTCMFCGGPASSKEDAWPLWLVEMLDAQGGVEVSAEQGGQPLEPWHQKGHFTKVRFVCAPCNNGWMSRLENRAKPILTRLLGKDAITLSSEDQATVALWSVKCAMVFEPLRGTDAWFYSAEQRHAFRSELRIPAYTAVWLARCVDLTGAHSAASDTVSEPRGYLTTMAFGSLAIQVLTIRPPDSVSPDTPLHVPRPPGPWEDLLVRVCPSFSDVSWPPKLGLLGEPGLEMLMHRYQIERTAG